MKFKANDVLFAGVASAFLCTLTEAAIAIPRSYIVEYTQQGDKPNYQKSITDDLSQYEDLYQVHHMYSSPIFQGMSFTLKDSPQLNSKPEKQHLSKYKSQQPASYAASDKHHPVFNQLQKNPIIKNIYPIYEVPRPQSFASQRNVTFPYSNEDSQIYDFHQKLGITGEGILVGVLDSGIDYYHPALGAGFGEGYKVKFGKNLVPAAKDEEYGAEPLGEDDPYDPCTNTDRGHGTHVAGIIAGYDPEKNFSGIAPNASLAIFRIFGCQGGAGEDTVIKAMEMAYQAGCQVINLSLGIQNSWPEDAMSVVADRLANNGVIVVGVAGNQGSEGVYSQNAPASGRDVVSVASVDNSFYLSEVMTLDIIPNENFPYVLSSTTSSFPNGLIAPILDDSGSIPYGCENDLSITSETAQDKILLVKRGHCTFTEKIATAKNVGAIGLLFYDPDETSSSVPVAKTEADSLPCAGIELKLANRIMDHYKTVGTNTPILIEFPDEQKVIYQESAGKISSFSSTGPTYELDLKPTITGIGGDVYSTLPLGLGGWGVRSGTSMASPHVAGTSALLINYYSKQNQNITSKYIVEQLQNHAKPIMSTNRTPFHPIIQGAGLVQPFDAINSKVHISPAQISFNDTASTTEYKTHTIDIVNSYTYPIIATLENLKSQSIQPYENKTSYIPTEPAITNGSVTVDLAFSATTVTLPAMSTTKVEIKVVLPAPDDEAYHYQMYGGFVSVKRTDTSETLATVPYFGVLGNMIDIPVFDQGYPYLAPANRADDPPINQMAPYRFDISRMPITQPAIVMRLLTGSASIEVKILDANSTFVGIMSGGPWIYIQRNKLSAESYRSTISWDGKVVPSDSIITMEDGKTIVGDQLIPVPDGTYYISVRALKHFGDSTVNKDWEEWKSGPIVVQN